MSTQTGYRFQAHTLLKLNVYSRLENIPLRAAAEQAINEWAREREREHNVNWRDFEHPQAGYAECVMFARHDMDMNPDEKLQRKLVLEHRAFFYEDNGKPNPRNLRVLWPDISAYAKQYDNAKTAWEVGEKMAEVLKKAKITPPEWGPGAKVKA